MSDYNEHIPDGAGDNGDADELVYQSEGCGKAAHCLLLQQVLQQPHQPALLPSVYVAGN